MAKRGADTQMTRENYSEGRDDEDDMSLGGPTKASSSVLAGRKIIKPRSRMSAESGASSGFSFGAGNATPNAFGGVGATLTSSNPFGSLKNTGISAPETATPKHTSETNSNKIRALNEKFIALLNKLILPNTVADLRPIAEKYLQYYNQIETEKAPTAIPKVSVPISNGFAFGAAPKPSADSTPKPTVASSQTEKEPAQLSKPEVVTIDVDSEDSESADDIKIEGPQFTLSSKPVAKNSPFSFGPKKEKKPSSDSESESEVEIKGPSFTFNKPIKDAVFKFKGTEDKNKFSFGTNTPAEKPADSSTEKKTAPSTVAPSKPAFSFGGTALTKDAEKNEALKSFSFGSTTATSGAFAFKSVQNPEQEKPTPSFGFPAAEKNKKDTAPGVSSFPSNPLPAKETASKTGFSFNPPSSTQKEDEPSPAVSFGSNSNSKPFSFGSTEKKDGDKPLFSFNPPAEKKDAPAFSYGGEKKEAAPAFSFGAEKKDASKPTFSFGAAKNDAAKPAFSFSSDKKTDTKPAFSFGATPLQGGLFGSSAPSSDSLKPFSFGSSNGTQQTTGFGSLMFGKTPENGQKPANTFSFGASALTAPASQADSAIVTPLDLVPEEETGGDFKPVASLSSEAISNSETGEENEEVLYTKKAKLMLFDPSNKETPYANRGVGDLKVLKAKDSGKSRILVRADGGLRVLLNSLVSKDISYSTIGNGSMVRVPVVNADKSIETFVLRVKTPADGEELLASLNGAK